MFYHYYFHFSDILVYYYSFKHRLLYSSSDHNFCRISSSLQYKPNILWRGESEISASEPTFISILVDYRFLDRYISQIGV
jgi:hypothetical protein